MYIVELHIIKNQHASDDMNEKYNVIFEGKILPGQDINVVKSLVLKHLKVPSSQLDAFFSGKPIHLKKDISLSEALELRTKLEQLGLIVTVSAASMLSLSIFQDEEKKEVKKVESPIKKIVPPQAVADNIENSRAEFKGDYDYDDYEPLAPIPSIFGFDIEGRFGRLSFLNAQLALILSVLPLGILYFVLIFLLNAGILSLLTIIVIAVVYVIFSYRIVILRLHDVNLSGWFVLIYSLGRIPVVGPFIEFFFTLFLVFAPGTKGENNYGSRPEQGSKIGLIGFIIIVPLMIGAGSYIEYKERLKLDKVATSLKTVESLQNSIQNYYVEHKKMPTIINNVSGWQDVLRTSPVIQKLDLTQKGMIEITYNDQVEQDANLKIALYVNEGLMTWRCYDTTLSYKLIPLSCLADIESYYESDDGMDYGEFENDSELLSW